MPGYINDALIELGHPRPKKKHAPYPWSPPPKYGAKKQYAKQDSSEPTLDKDKIKYIEHFVQN